MDKLDYKRIELIKSSVENSIDVLQNHIDKCNKYEVDCTASKILVIEYKEILNKLSNKKVL